MNNYDNKYDTQNYIVGTVPMILAKQLGYTLSKINNMLVLIPKDLHHAKIDKNPTWHITRFQNHIMNYLKAMIGDILKASQEASAYSPAIVRIILNESEEPHYDQ